MYIEIPRTRRLVSVASRHGLTVRSRLHCSLSKPFALWPHEIDPFLKTLRKHLERLEPFTLKVLDNVVILENDQRQKFHGLRVATSTQLLTALSAVDDALKLYRKDTYFVDPIFHVTLQSDDESHSSQSDDDDLEEEEEGDDITVFVSSLTFKCGHRHINLDFS